MELFLYIIITWFVVTYFVTVLPKVDLVKNIILYMLLLILVVSAFTIAYINLRLIDFTNDKVKFAAVALWKNVVIPLLLVILGSIFGELKTYPKKIAAIIFAMILLLSMELINLKLRFHVYIKWNFIQSVLSYSVFIFVAAMLNKVLYILQQRGKLNK